MWPPDSQLLSSVLKNMSGHVWKNIHLSTFIFYQNQTVISTLSTKNLHFLCVFFLPRALYIIVVTDLSHYLDFSRLFRVFFAYFLRSGGNPEQGFVLVLDGVIVTPVSYSLFPVPSRPAGRVSPDLEPLVPFAKNKRFHTTIWR